MKRLSVAALKTISRRIPGIDGTLILSLLLPATAAFGCPDGYTCVGIDPELYRGNLGYALQDISPKSSNPDRIANSADVEVDVGFFSRRHGARRGVTAYDSFYFGMTLGKMASTPIKDEYGASEDAFSVSMRSGYDILLGYRTDSYGAFAGLKFDFGMALVGGSMLPFQSALPLMLRGELPLYKGWRAVGSVWSDFHPEGLTGLTAELPIGEKFWIYGGYERRGGKVEWPWTTVSDPHPASLGSSTIMSAGLRVAAFY